MWFSRALESGIESTLLRGKSVLLLGPRQTGKTSLARRFPHARYINLMEIERLNRYREDPGLFLREMRHLSTTAENKPLVIIDEIQKLPEITDSCQILLDEGVIQLIITGSSARKVRNLLPGRVVKFTMSALTSAEVDSDALTLESLLANGMLPGILSQENQSDIDDDLASYVALYLEEEIRKEALVRNLGAFSNFLRLACVESGNTVNFSALSQELGISRTTITEYYRILEDCMLIRRFEPLTKTHVSRRRLTKSPKFTIFDLGVRRAGAREPANPTDKQLGHILEQHVGIELAATLENNRDSGRVMYWRDHAGPEVDYVVDRAGVYTAIEVKLTKKPKEKDIRHLITFREAYPETEQCYLVANIDYPYEMQQGILAIPWRDVAQLVL